jgi:hypothetical protein
MNYEFQKKVLTSAVENFMWKELKLVDAKEKKSELKMAMKLCHK